MQWLPKKQQNWSPWFAIWPVWVGASKVWLETVCRRYDHDAGCWRYRFPTERGIGATMTDVELLAYCRDDAAKWAEQFRQTAVRLGYSDMDEGWLIGWFANAIENADIIRH